MRSICYMEVRDRVREITNFQESEDMLIRASDKILEMAYIARKEGLLALEEELNHLGEGDFWHYFRDMLFLVVEGAEVDVTQDICLSRYFTLDLKGAEGLVFLIFLTGTLAIQKGEAEYLLAERLKALLPLPVLQIYEPRRLREKEQTLVALAERLCQQEQVVDKESDDYFIHHMVDYTLAHLTDADMQRLLKEVSDELPIAMKGMEGKTVKKVLDNLPSKEREEILEDMEYMGPVRHIDVTASKQKILNILVNLIGNGEINGDNYSHLSAFM